MRIAVMTFTRDRLDYTKHCFTALERNAGCDYDHFVLDQGSTDGTLAYLLGWYHRGEGHREVYFGKENIGICAGANKLLADFAHPGRYDVIVRYDNDCEVLQPDTLKTCAMLADTYGAIAAPRVLGLNNPPATIRTVKLGNHYLDETGILGGIFMAIPARIFTEHRFRYDETMPLGTGDEAIVPFWRERGGVCGYVHGLSVNHYETTEGQKARYPEYEARKREELAA